MVDKFIKDQQVKFEETKNYEFKEIQVDNKNPVDTIKKVSPEYIGAFLNSLGTSAGTFATS
jgi:hypothetical protein